MIDCDAYMLAYDNSVLIVTIKSFISYDNSVLILTLKSFIVQAPGEALDTPL